MTVYIFFWQIHKVKMKLKRSTASVKNTSFQTRCISKKGACHHANSNSGCHSWRPGRQRYLWLSSLFLTRQQKGFIETTRATRAKQPTCTVVSVALVTRITGTNGSSITVLTKRVWTTRWRTASDNSLDNTKQYALYIRNYSLTSKLRLW